MAQLKAYKSPDGRSEVLKIYDYLLKELTIPHERISISTSYGETFVITAGNAEAPPMVLLHGSSMNSVMWVSDIKEYYKNYRVYALDLPGEPGKSDERQLPFNTDEYADWLLDTFEKLEIKT